MKTKPSLLAFDSILASQFCIAQPNQPVRGGVVDTEPMKTLATNPAATNKKIKLLWIACGKDDFALTGAKTLSETLTKIGIKHTFLESEGAHHWRVWRQYLREVSPLLFRQPSQPSATRVQSSPEHK